MSSRIESTENEFRDFMNRLLSAEVYEGAREERSYFSFDTLKRIIGGFCNIIAEHLECDSCTINLQLYDCNQVDDETFYEWVFDHFHEKGVSDTVISGWMMSQLSQQGITEKSAKEWIGGYLVRASEGMV